MVCTEHATSDLRMQKPNRNPNHPKKGSTTKVEPIRELQAICSIKEALHDNARNYCLFVLGINTAYRASELLSLSCGQVSHLSPGDTLSVRQSKTSKHRTIALNGAAVSSIRRWLSIHPSPDPCHPLFISRTGNAITVPTLNNMVKKWCANQGLPGNYGSHSLRKTWGFHQLRHNHRTPPHMMLPVLMSAFGHASQKQTLDYLCIQSDEVLRLFMELEL